MGNQSTLELVIQVDLDQANKSIKTINTGLSNMEQAAVKAARGASSGMDSLTKSLMEGVRVGDLFKNAIGALGSTLSGPAMALSAMAAAGWGAMKSLGSFGDEIQDTASRMGLTTKEVGQFRFALQYAGGDMGALERAMRKLSQEIDEGGGNLQELGISYRDVSTGALKPTSAILLDLSQALAVIPEGALRNAAAIKVLGRSAMEVLPDLLELSEGLRRAEELQKGYSAEQLARWSGYQHQATEIEWAWESLKRSMKEPLAAVVSVVIRGFTGDKSDIGAGGFKALMDQIPKLAREEAERRLAIAGQSGFFTEQQYRDLQKAIDDSPQARSALKQAAQSFSLGLKLDSLFPANRIKEALRQPAKTDPMSMAVDKLKEFQEELRSIQQRGAGFSEALPVVDKIEAQKRRILGIEAEVEATKKLEAAEKSLASWEKQVAERNLGPVERAFKKRDELPVSLRERGTAVALQEASAELAKMEEEYRKIGSEMEKVTIERWAKESDAAVKELDRSTSQFVKDWIQGIKEIQDGVRELDRRSIEGSRAASAHSGRMAQLNAGPGQEVAAAQEVYAMRVASIQQEAEIVEQHAHLYDIDQKRWELQQAMQQAGYDYEESLAELQRSRLDELRSSMEGLLDAAFAKSRSILDALKGMAQAVFLTPIKQGFSTLMAQAIMPLMYGRDGGGGLMGGITSLFSRSRGLGNVELVNGAVPVVITGAGGGFGVSSITAGGTGGFAGVGSSPTEAAGTIRALSSGGITAAGLAPLALAGSGLGLMGAYSAGQSSNGVLKGLAPIIGALSGAFGAASLTAMFPVLASLGPWGLVAGAGIGAVVGLIGIFHKSATAKAREKVKETYGVDISDKAVLRQIVDTARQACGGNLDMAIRTQQVRDLIQLYAMTTGQKPTGMPASMTPVSVMESGGSLFQTATYQNGTALPGLGGLPSLDNIGAGTPSMTVVVNNQLPANQVGAYMEGKVIQTIVKVPRAIQAAAISATRSNAGRRQMVSLQLSPGLVIS